MPAVKKLLILDGRLRGDDDGYGHCLPCSTDLSGGGFEIRSLCISKGADLLERPAGSGIPAVGKAVAEAFRRSRIWAKSRLERGQT